MITAASFVRCLCQTLRMSNWRVQTLLLSVGVGTACTAFAPHVIVEALALTAAIVVGLTAYAFHASRKGKDFTFLGPILFSSESPHPA